MPLINLIVYYKRSYILSALYIILYLTIFLAATLPIFLLPGELILAIPDIHALTKDRVLENYPFLQDLFVSSPKFDLNDVEILALGIFLLKKKVPVNRGDGTDDRHSHSLILSTLPEKQYPVTKIPDNIKRCLPPTYQRKVDEIQLKYNNLYVQIYEAFEEFNSNNGKDIVPIPSLDDFLWALASVQSRTFTTKRFMIPGIDLINHKFGTKVDFEYNAETKQFEFRSTKSSRDIIKKGEEITFSYGDEIDNLTLLINFSFCTPKESNERQGVLLSFDLDDLLLAAQKILPNVYLDPICQNFKIQLKQENKYPDSLLAFNVAKGTIPVDENDTSVSQGTCTEEERKGSPGFYLRTALSVVQDLGERLLSDATKDDQNENPESDTKISKISLKGLDSYMMKKLLEQRKFELEQCFNRINEIETTGEDDPILEEWKPFLSSIKVLLKDEMQNILSYPYSITTD